MFKYVLSGALLVGAFVGLAGHTHAGDTAAATSATEVKESTGVILAGGFLTFAEAAVEAQRWANLGWVTTVILGNDGLYYVDGV
jgi:hypothetical protein